MPDNAENASLPYPTQAEIMGWVRIKFPTKTSAVHRAMKLGEEAGEVLGAVTKMDEGRKTKADLGQELAQAVICCMGLAEAVGIDLDQEVRQEWARVGRPVLDAALCLQPMGSKPYYLNQDQWEASRCHCRRPWGHKGTHHCGDAAHNDGRPLPEAAPDTGREVAE